MMRSVYLAAFIVLRVDGLDELAIHLDPAATLCCCDADEIYGQREGKSQLANFLCEFGAVVSSALLLAVERE